MQFEWHCAVYREGGLLKGIGSTHSILRRAHLYALGDKNNYIPWVHIHDISIQVQQVIPDGKVIDMKVLMGGQGLP